MCSDLNQNQFGIIKFQSPNSNGFTLMSLPKTLTIFCYYVSNLYRLEQATGLAFRFVIGRSKDAKRMENLEKEIEKYRDFMIIDVEEEYSKLPHKT